MATAAYPATRLNPLLRAQLAQIDAGQVLELLGEILEPSVNSPFTLDNDAFFDALEPVGAAYIAAFRRLRAAADGDAIDHDASFFDAVDRAYDERRDALCGRASL